MNTTTRTLDAGPLDATRRGYLGNTYLPSYRDGLNATKRLRALAWNRKPGPDQDALYTGYAAVQRNLEVTVERAAEVGGLPLMWEGSKALQGGAA